MPNELHIWAVVTALIFGSSFLAVSMLWPEEPPSYHVVKVKRFEHPKLIREGTTP